MRTKDRAESRFLRDRFGQGLVIRHIIYIYICVCVCVCVCVCEYISIYVHICVYIYIYICVCVCEATKLTHITSFLGYLTHLFWWLIQLTPCLPGKLETTNQTMIIPRPHAPGPQADTRWKIWVGKDVDDVKLIDYIYIYIYICPPLIVAIIYLEWVGMGWSNYEYWASVSPWIFRLPSPSISGQCQGQGNENVQGKGQTGVQQQNLKMEGYHQAYLDDHPSSIVVNNI